MAWGPPVLWAFVLFLLSELRATPRFARGLVSFSDELVHFGLYFALGWLLALSRKLGGARIPHLALIAVGAAYGALDEWHQSFVPRRSPEITDWFADVAGVAIGYAFFWLSGVMSDPRSQEGSLE